MEGGGALRRERRMVIGLAASLDASAGVTAPQLAAIQHDLVGELRSFGATVEELPSAGMIAFFGPEPTENAAGRAAHAALVMVRLIQHWQGEPEHVTVRCAIHARRCLVVAASDVAEIDSADKQEVRLGLARLLQGTEFNTIVVDQRAAEFLRRRFELEPAGAGVLDRVYRVRGPGRTEFAMGGRSLSPFVGRNQDLSALQNLLRRGEEGRGQVVGIVGEPGVGKSRLLHEFRQSLIPGRVTYLEGRCLSYGNTTPYLPILAIIRS